jgi:hypothetical protein
VPGLYVVPVWLTANGGGFAVPKYTSCENALRRTKVVGIDASLCSSSIALSASTPISGIRRAKLSPLMDAITTRSVVNGPGPWFAAIN